MKKLALGLGAAVLVLAGVVIGRGLPRSSRQVPVEPAAAPAIDADDVAAALAEAIRFQTVSNQDPARFDAGQFAGLQAFLARRYPRVQQTLTREVVNDYSLLYTWPGRGTGKPIVLLAHLDVVPVEAGTEAGWTEAPFSGAIADGYVWGRGALDDKSSALGILEAVEYLLGSGFQPARTVYLAFGHDEEVSGRRGAAALSARLRERGIDADFVLDEGGSILDGMIPGVGAPVATVCVGEKGYVTVELTASGPGGHSSMPPPHTPIGVLSAAIEQLERAQMPAHVGAAMDGAVAFLGPEMPFGERVVFANLWLFGPLVAREMAQRPQTNAIIRTTTAPTIFDSGVKENILPASARAVVNFRILPGDTVATVVEHVRRTIDDPTIDSARARRGERSDAALRPRGPGLRPHRPHHSRHLSRHARHAVRDPRRHRRSVLQRRQRQRVPLPPHAHARRGPGPRPRHQRAHRDRRLRGDDSLLYRTAAGRA